MSHSPNSLLSLTWHSTSVLHSRKGSSRAFLALMMAGFILLQPVTLMAQSRRVSKTADPISRGEIQPANPDTGSGAVALNTLGVAATENFNTLSNTAGS